MKKQKVNETVTDLLQSDMKQSKWFIVMGIPGYWVVIIKNQISLIKRFSSSQLIEKMNFSLQGF